MPWRVWRKMVLQRSVESNPSSVIPPLCLICCGLAWLCRLGSVAAGSVNWLARRIQLGRLLVAPSLPRLPGKWLRWKGERRRKEFAGSTLPGCPPSTPTQASPSRGINSCDSQCFSGAVPYSGQVRRFSHPFRHLSDIHQMSHAYENNINTSLGWPCSNLSQILVELVTAFSQWPYPPTSLQGYALCFTLLPSLPRNTSGLGSCWVFPHDSHPQEVWRWCWNFSELWNVCPIYNIFRQACWCAFHSYLLQTLRNSLSSPQTSNYKLWCPIQPSTSISAWEWFSVVCGMQQGGYKNHHVPSGLDNLNL